MTVMFGRELERVRLEELLGRGSVAPVGISIEGAPGIGKTTVWRHAVGSARARGYLVLTAAPSEADSALAFSGLGDLFDGLDHKLLDRLADPQRRALGAALYLREASEAPSDLDALPRAVLSVLRQLASDATVVVAIDDEQWLDRASARVLAFALRRIREERINLLLSRRVDSDGTLWPEVQRGFDPGIEAIELAGLDPTSTSELLARHLTRKIPRRVLRRVHEVSGGNPLYVAALGAELERQSADHLDERQLRIPSTLADAIAQRLERVRAGVETPLLAIAALANPTVGLLGAAIEQFDPAELADAVHAGVLEISGDRVRFTHPLLASVQYSSVPPPDRRELHLHLAAVVADEEERALHLALGSEMPSDGVAGEIELAGGLAARRGAPEAAAELLEHAIRLTPIDRRADRWSRMNRAAEQHLAAGDFAAARRLLEQLLLEQPGGPTSARARLSLAIVRKDDFEFAAAMLEQALIDAGDDDRLITEIELIYSDWHSNLGDCAGMARHAQAAVASAERLGEPGPLASTLAQLGHALFLTGQPIRHDLFQRAIELERHGSEKISTFFLPSTIYGATLRRENDVEAARPLLEAAIDRARRRGEEAWLPALLVRLALLEWEAGNWNESDRYLAEASEATRQQLDDEIESWIAHADGQIAAGRGQLDRARSCAREVLRLSNANHDMQMQRDGDVLLAEIEVMSGEPETAHNRLEARRERAIASGPICLEAVTLPLWSSDIEALIALERLDDAQTVLDSLLDRALGCANPNAVAIARRCEGLVLAARGELDRALEAMEAALADHAQRPLPFELGRSLIEKGSIERRAKRKTAAKQTFERALQLLEPLGAAPWVDRARDELGRIGLRRPAVNEGLTPAQHRVAELVASGNSNAEIAGILYMSRRTVESHLTKIYRQLGIRSRSQLAATLAANETSANGHATRPQTNDAS